MSNTEANTRQELQAALEHFKFERLNKLQSMTGFQTGATSVPLPDWTSTAVLQLHTRQPHGRRHDNATPCLSLAWQHQQAWKDSFGTCNDCTL